MMSRILESITIYIFFSFPPSSYAVPQPDEPDFLTTVDLNFEKAAAKSTHPEGLIKQIQVCDSVIEVNFPLKVVRLCIIIIISLYLYLCLSLSLSLYLYIYFVHKEERILWIHEYREREREREHWSA